MAASEIMREYLIRLGYQIDQSSSARFDDSIAKSAKLVTEFAAAVEATAAVVVAGFSRMTTGLEQLYFAAQRSQSTVENIQAVGYAVSQLGGTAEGAQAALESFGRFLQSSPGAEGPIKNLGVQTRDANGQLRDTAAIFEDVGAALRKLPSYRAQAYAQLFGIDYRTLQAMRQGTEQFGAQYRGFLKAAGVDADKAAAAAHRFQVELKALYGVLDALRQKLVLALGERLGNMLSQFRAMVMRNMDLITKAVTYFSDAVVAAATVVTRIIFRIGQAFDELSPSGKRLVEVLGAILIAWRALSLGFVASPIGAIIAGLTGLLLLFDDFKTQQEGGKSLIDWKKLLPEVEPYLAPIRTAFGEFRDSLVNSVWPDIRGQAKQFFGVDLAEFARSVPGFLDGVKRAFGELRDDFKAFTGDSTVSLGGVVDFLNRVNVAAQKMGDDVHRALQPVVAFINDEMLAAWKAVNDAVQGIVGFLRGDWTAAWQGAMGIVHELFGMLDEAITAVQNAAPALGRKLFGEPLNSGEDAALKSARAVPGQGGGDVGPAIAFDDAVKYLMQTRGLSYNRAVGFVTNLEAESGLHPGAVGDSGQAVGIAQWHPDRQAAIAEHFGKRIQDMSAREQLEAAGWEAFEGPEKRAGQAIQAGPNDARIAAMLTSRLYERPRDVEGQAIARGNAAASHASHGLSEIAWDRYAPPATPASAANDYGPRRDRVPSLDQIASGQLPPVGYFNIPPPMGPGGGAGDVNVNQNNTFHITGANSSSIADEVLRGQRRVAGDLARNVTGAVR